MGLIRAASGSIWGTLGDQWRDFFTVPEGLASTAAVFPAILRGTNNGRGSNTHSSKNIISNGSKIVVPEGYVLLTFQDGRVTSIATEPGNYTWDSSDINSKTIFTGNGLVDSLIKQSWERFKFGGIPGSQQIALFVSTNELPNNPLGTTSEIYWDDAFLNTQVGVLIRGTFTLKIVNPLVFVENFVPASVLQNAQTFDFTDPSNPQASQILNEVNSVLASALSNYTNTTTQQNRITSIQQDAIGFANALSEAVESAYRWSSTRGIAISKVALGAVEYDEPTKELLKTVQRADALSGSRGNVNLQSSVAAGIQAAGSVEGSAGLVGIGIAAGNLGLSGLQQSPQAENVGVNSLQASESGQDLVGKLTELKKLLELGLITESDFELAKQKLLNL